MADDSPYHHELPARTLHSRAPEPAETSAQEVWFIDVEIRQLARSRPLITTYRLPGRSVDAVQSVPAKEKDPPGRRGRGGLSAAGANWPAVQAVVHPPLVLNGALTCDFVQTDGPMTILGGLR